MSRIFMDNQLKSEVFSKMVLCLVLGGMSLILAGCIGGNTYGTGVPQGRQLLADLEGMMSMGSKKNNRLIDYSERPGLVKPPEKNNLPEPLKHSDDGPGVNWPENPEQKLARIRAQAEEADPRSGAISVAELRRKKVGVPISRGKMSDTDMDRDGHWMIKAMSNDKTGKKARAIKSKYAYSKGAMRKYLTEPPVEYRVPISSAPAGDLGIPEGEKEKRTAKAEKLKRQNETGMWTGN